MTAAQDTQSCAQALGHSRSTIALSAIALALVVFQAMQLFRLIDRFAVDVPFWDQWDFYNPFFKAQGLWEIFSFQHGPHRQGAGSCIIWAVNAATGWNQRAQAFTVGMVMAAAAAAFLWLKQRLFGSLQWYDAIPVLMILSLKPMEIYFSCPNVSHGPLPLLLLILLCIALTLNTMLRYVLALAIYAITLFTGYGFLSKPILPVLLIIDFAHGVRSRQWRQACIPAAALICCLAAIACFYHDYSFSHTAECFLAGEQPWYLYPAFMAITFSTAALPDRLLSPQSIAIGLSTIAVLLCMLASACVKLRCRDAHYPRHQAVFVLIAFSLIFSAASAAGRLGLGLETAGATRYVPLIMPGFIGAYLFGLNYPALVNSRIVVPLLFAAAALLMLTGWPWQRYHGAEQCRKEKASWVAAFKQTNDVGLADALAGYSVYPDPEQTGLALKLEWLRINRYSLFRDNAGPNRPAAPK